MCSISLWLLRVCTGNLNRSSIRVCEINYGEIQEIDFLSNHRFLLEWPTVHPVRCIFTIQILWTRARWDCTRLTLWTSCSTSIFVRGEKLLQKCSKCFLLPQSHTYSNEKWYYTTADWLLYNTDTITGWPRRQTRLKLSFMYNRMNRVWWQVERQRKKKRLFLSK